MLKKQQEDDFVMKSFRTDIFSRRFLARQFVTFLGSLRILNFFKIFKTREIA